MKFGIAISAYERPDGSSPTVLRRSIESVIAQTRRDWKLYIIGDHYGWKFQNVIESCFPIENPQDVFFTDLPYAIGRDTGLTGRHLWCNGGVGAMQFGLTLQHLEEIDIHCHLDFDDVWTPDHLETLAEQYEKDPVRIAFVYTQARRDFLDGNPFPPGPGDMLPVDRLPEPRWLAHSSASWKLSLIDTMYVPRLHLPADGYMWKRMAEEIERKQLRSIFVPKVTVIRDSEKSTIALHPND